MMTGKQGISVHMHSSASTDFLSNIHEGVQTSLLAGEVLNNAVRQACWKQHRLEQILENVIDLEVREVKARSQTQ